MIAKAKPAISEKWSRLFADHLPGYDPVATAGDCWFDEDAADRVCRFSAKFCRHVKGESAGKTYVYEPHEMAIAGCLFGWKRPDGTRRYKQLFYFVPRKNSKSTFVATLICYEAFTGNEPGFEMYTTSGDQTQARVVYEMVCQMIQAEPVLSAHAKVMKYCIAFTDRNTGLQCGVFRPLTKSAANKHGLNTHVLVNDELHAHKTPELIEAMETSMGARRQPLILNITTADYDRPDSVCNQKEDYACKVRDGLIDDASFLPVIYAATKDDDWKDVEVWKRVNPNLGKSFKLEFLESEFRKAKENPAFENTFKRLYLNLRTEQSVRLIDMESWDAVCKGDDPVRWRHEMESRLRGRKCYAGLDLGSVSDLSSMVRVFPEPDGSYILLPDFWVTEQRISNRRTQTGRRLDIDYSGWKNQGFIRTTSGETTDYDTVRRDINEIHKRTPFNEIALDTSFQGLQIAQQLSNEDAIEMVAFGQGFNDMNAPVRFFLEAILNKKLIHGNNPVLRWMASCVSGREKENMLRIYKQDSSGKVDGIVAAVMGIGRAMLTAKPESVYERRGPLIVEF